MHVAIVYFHFNNCIQWLKEEFLEYLDAWERSVKARPNYKAVERKKMMLSTETLLGLRITGRYYCIHEV